MREIVIRETKGIISSGSKNNFRYKDTPEQISWDNQ